MSPRGHRNRACDGEWRDLRSDASSLSDPPQSPRALDLIVPAGPRRPPLRRLGVGDHLGCGTARPTPAAHGCTAPLRLLWNTCGVVDSDGIRCHRGGGLRGDVLVAARPPGDRTSPRGRVSPERRARRLERPVRDTDPHPLGGVRSADSFRPLLSRPVGLSDRVCMGPLSALHPVGASLRRPQRDDRAGNPRGVLGEVAYGRPSFRAAFEGSGLLLGNLFHIPGHDRLPPGVRSGHLSAGLGRAGRCRGVGPRGFGPILARRIHARVRSGARLQRDAGRRRDHRPPRRRATGQRLGRHVLRPAARVGRHDPRRPTRWSNRGRGPVAGTRPRGPASGGARAHGTALGTLPPTLGKHGEGSVAPPSPRSAARPVATTGVWARRRAPATTRCWCAEDSQRTSSSVPL